MQNIPFNGAGRRPAPHPLLATIPSPTAISLHFIQSALCRMYICCVIQEYVAIHEMWKRKEKYLFNMRGWAGPAPWPLPPAPLAEPWGGEGWRAGSSLGILSREGGFSGNQAASWNGRFFWRVNSAGYSRGWIQQVAWQDILAGHFGRFIWRVFIANGTSGFQRKKKQSKEKKRNV